MVKLIINGPARLSGKVEISGSKNAALPIIAATLLAKGECTLTNVPNITDIHNMLEILQDLGARVVFRENTLKIDATNINGKNPDKKLVKSFRASILLVGPLLARNKKVEIATPGGCFIGNRPLDEHFDAFEKLGAVIEEREEDYRCTTSGLVGNKIVMRLMSVTATENAVLAAVTAKGTSKILLAAAEPHVQDLCHFLNKMGAKISGIGTNELVIEGVKDLKPASHSVIADEIEAGTYIIAAAATNSEIRLENIDSEKVNYSMFEKFREANVKLEMGKDYIEVKKSSRIKPVNIWTAPAPHFPSDLQAPFAVLMTMAEGSSLIHETMFEARLNYLKELQKMGANASILDPHRAVIIGPTGLFGKRIETLDLRAGATLIIAALVAEGKSEIINAEIIDRGYENIVEKLQDLGAEIERVQEVKHEEQLPSNF